MLYSRCRCYLLSFSDKEEVGIDNRLVGVGDLRVFPQVFQVGLTEADHFEVYEEKYLRERERRVGYRARE